MGAASIELNVEDLRQLDEAVSRIEVHGERYPPHLATLVGR